MGDEYRKPVSRLTRPELMLEIEKRNEKVSIFWDDKDMTERDYELVKRFRKLIEWTEGNEEEIVEFYLMGYRDKKRKRDRR